jgi:hypothetical protein
MSDSLTRIEAAAAPAHRQPIAVTDAVSPDGYFPLWHRYYASQLGAANLIVVTYAGMAQHFSSFELRRIYELPGAYNDDRRLAAINEIGLEIVAANGRLLRADVDEFIVPDPRKYPSLREYLARTDAPYVTARGFDVIQSPLEAPLDYTRPIVLEQRQFAFAVAALNKTCVTSVPLRWGRGFHQCTAPPQFGELYLLHLKRADIKFQKAWAKHRVSNINDDAYAKKYYEDTISYVDAFHRQRFELPTLAGDALYDRADFDAKFLATLKKNEASGLYEGPFLIDEVNVEIPEGFRGAF